MPDPIPPPSAADLAEAVLRVEALAVGNAFCPLGYPQACAAVLDALRMARAKADSFGEGITLAESRRAAAERQRDWLREALLGLLDRIHDPGPGTFRLLAIASDKPTWAAIDEARKALVEAIDA